jgi:cytochrome c oxidase subunit IV
MKSKTWIVVLGVALGFIAYSFSEEYEGKTILGIPSTQFSWILLSLGALVESFLIQIYMQWSASKTALLTYSGIILGVIALIFYHVIFFNLNHNLAHIEIIIISIIVLPSAFLGAFSSKLIQYFKK